MTNFDIDFGKNAEDLRLPEGDPIVLPDGRRIFVTAWKPEWNVNDICHVALLGIFQGPEKKKCPCGKDSMKDHTLCDDCFYKVYETPDTKKE